MNTLKTSSEGLGWGWLRFVIALWLQTLIHAKSGPPASSEDQRQWGQASSQGKPSLPSLSLWPQQGRWPSPPLSLLIIVSTQRDTGFRPRGSGKRAKHPEVFGDPDEHHGPMARWLGMCLCVEVLMWRPHCLGCRSGSGLTIGWKCRRG